jgi:hypothetical protein
MQPPTYSTDAAGATLSAGKKHAFPWERGSKPLGRPPHTLCKRGHDAGRYANGTCKECQRAASHVQYRENMNAVKAAKRAYYINNPKQIMLNAARERAKENGYACTITTADIVIPEFCPLLGIRLERKQGGNVQASSPSLDKIKPKLGYVPGNVWVISHRANSLKGNATLQELQTLTANLAKKHTFPWRGA